MIGAKRCDGREIKTSWEYKCMLQKYRYLLFLALLVFPEPAVSRSEGSIMYTYPEPNASGVPAQTGIGIRYSQSIARHNLGSGSFAVTGSISGQHEGSVTLAMDGLTVIFTPVKPL